MVLQGKQFSDPKSHILGRLLGATATGFALSPAGCAAGVLTTGASSTGSVAGLTGAGVDSVAAEAGWGTVSQIALAAAGEDPDSVFFPAGDRVEQETRTATMPNSTMMAERLFFTICSLCQCLKRS